MGGMFDTHCHLNFKRFKKNVDEVIARARGVGVNHIVVPGTDVPTSQRAVELASQHEGIYAAVGIHPHHVYEYHRRDSDQSIGERIKHDLGIIETMMEDPHVVAVGEVGMDKYPYNATKYPHYTIDDTFLSLQRDIFTAHIHLAIRYGKALVLHNREAKKEFLDVLSIYWDDALKDKVVFHCCEAEEEGSDPSLLDFALERGVYIGVDGDITYSQTKQEFIKHVPLHLLVVETDAPFLLPEPLKSERRYPNEPTHIPYIIEAIATIKKRKKEEVIDLTTQNAHILFGISP